MLITDWRRRHYILLKEFYTFMSDHTLYCRTKHFCCYCLQNVNTEQTLKCNVKDCFKINGKQRTKLPRKGEYMKVY